MKSICKTILSAFLITSVAVGLSGCLFSFPQNNKSKVDYDGYLWTETETRKFHELSFPERKEVVAKYLEYIGEDAEKCSFDVPHQNSINSFSAQSAYNTSVRCEDGTIFTVWLESDGRMIDDRFMNDIQSEIQEYFADKIHEVYPEAAVYTDSGLHNMPSKEWKKSDSIEEMLKTEEAYTFIRVAFPLDKNITQSDFDSILNSLGEAKNDVTNIALFNLEVSFDTVFDDIDYSTAVIHNTL